MNLLKLIKRLCFLCIILSSSIIMPMNARAEQNISLFTDSQDNPIFQYYNGSQIVCNLDMVIKGNYSLYVPDYNTEWNEFLHTDNTKFILEPLQTYTVKFKYRINEISDNYLYFFARTNQVEFTSDKGWRELTGSVGQTYSAESTFTLDNYSDYFLVWGMRNGGSVSIDDIQIIRDGKVIVNETFEPKITLDKTLLKQPDYPDIDKGNITCDPQKVIYDDNSLYIETGDNEWNEFIHTDNNKLKLLAGNTYTVKFKYKIIKSLGSYLYFLVRTNKVQYTADKGWTELNGILGQTYNSETTFTLDNYNDYYMIWGVKNGGAVSIDNIEVVSNGKVIYKEDFEFVQSKELNETAFKLPPVNWFDESVILSNSDKVISGNYSLYSIAKGNREWNEFLHSDIDRIRLLPNTKYIVRFKYKIINSSSNYMYFFARSDSGGLSNDRGIIQIPCTESQNGTCESEFTTEKYSDYYLSWGIYSSGGVSIDDIEVICNNETIMKEDFELNGNLKNTKLKLPNWNFTDMCSVINRSNMTIGKGYSLYFASNNNNEWCEFLHSDSGKLIFKPNKTYTVSFTYKFIEPVGSYLYFVAKTSSNDQNLERGWTTMNGDLFETYTANITFTLGDQSSYYLLWGAKGGGAVIIDNIFIWEGEEFYYGETFGRASDTSLCYVYNINGRVSFILEYDIPIIKYSYDSNGNLVCKQKITVSASKEGVIP